MFLIIATTLALGPWPNIEFGQCNSIWTREIVRMRTFRVFFLDRAGQISALDEFRAEDDQAAISRARLFLSSAHGDGFDIWERDRHVHLELNQTQPVLH